MPQKLWNKYDRTFEAKGQKVQRWQKNSLKLKISNSQNQEKNSDIYSTLWLPKSLRNKSDQEIYEKYCRYLLGACDAWMAKYRTLKKKQEIEMSLTTKRNTSPSTTAPSTPSIPSTS